jgi:CPA2 family monovalent cation:H+ antiporter-2
MGWSTTAAEHAGAGENTPKGKQTQMGLPELLVHVAVALVAAFLSAFVAVRLRLPALVGYMLAGIAVGPHTPGFVADIASARALAEIGVILLMFGVGVQFSLRDLAVVRTVAVPGALIHGGIITVLGAAAGHLWGWSLDAALVLGLAISVASTVVALRALQQRDLLDTIHGRITVGWLIVEDLRIVLVLVLLPSLAMLLGSTVRPGGLAGAQPAGIAGLLPALGMALGKTFLFILLMLFVGARAVPWVLVQVARTGSRELFILSVLAMALGIAVGSTLLFGVSLALAAFLAGVVVSESDLSHQVAAEALPFGHAFAVLFFVSVGMLFDPTVLVRAPGQIAVLLLLIVLGKALFAGLLVLALAYPPRTALIVAASLSQIGEFSFIVAELGLALRLLPEDGYGLIIAGALLSIIIHPLVFRALGLLEAWLSRWQGLWTLADGRAAKLASLPEKSAEGQMRGHAVLCGYGRVGGLIAAALERRGFPYVVIEQNRQIVEALRRRGIPALYGDAANPLLLERVHLPQARLLVIAIPDPLATRQIVDFARRVNPQLSIVARTHSPSEWAYLQAQGVDEVVLGEQELALEMARYALRRFGVSNTEVQAILAGLRARGEGREGHA